MGEKVSNTRDRLFTPDFALLLLLTLANAAVVRIFDVNLPIFAKSMGADNVLVGLLMTVFMASAIAVRPLWGYLADWKGRKLAMVAGTVIAAAAVFSYRYVGAFLGLLVLRSISGVGFSAHTNTAATIAADIIPKKRITEGLGYFGMANTLALALAPALGLHIQATRGFRTLFDTAALIGLAGVGLALCIGYEKRLPPKPADAPAPRFSLYEKSAVPISSVLLALALAGGSLNTFIPIFASERGIANFSLYYTVFAAAVLSSRLFMGKLVDRLGPRRIIYPAIAGIALAFVLFAFAFSLPVLLAAGILYGLGTGTTQPLLNALMIKGCPDDRRGSGNSTFYTALDLGNAVGAAVAGVVSQYAGFTVSFLLCLVYIAAAAIAFTWNA